MSATRMFWVDGEAAEAFVYEDVGLFAIEALVTFPNGHEKWVEAATCSKEREVEGFGTAFIEMTYRGEHAAFHYLHLERPHAFP